jgi:hypothetical protein
MAVCIAAAACGRAPAPRADVTVEWNLTPLEPDVDRDIVARVIVFDPSSRPVGGATLQIEAHMSHPGMAPVIAPVSEHSNGVYAATLRLTMAGRWILFVNGHLSDGRTISKKLGEATVRPSG